MASQRQLIGRDQQLETLKQILSYGFQGNGHIVFIEGEYGIGKTFFLNEVIKRAQEDPQLSKATFVCVKCDQNVGTSSPYQPFIEILYELIKEEERKAAEKEENKERLNVIIEIIKDTAPDWLEAIPFVGPLAKAAIKTSLAVSSRMTEPSKGSDYSISQQDDLIDKSKLRRSQYTEAITRIASQHELLVLIIERAEWIDESSCNVLSRLCRVIGNQRIIFILSHRPETMNKFLKDLKTQARYESQAYNICSTISLGRWDKSEIRSYLEAKYGEPLHLNFPAWLDYLCNGIPLFVNIYVNLLQQKEVIKTIDMQVVTSSKTSRYKLDGDIIMEDDQWKTKGKLADISPSDEEEIEGFLDARIGRLLDDDLEHSECLKIGSVQGTDFFSIVLSQMLQKEYNYIIRKMSELERKLQVIERYKGPDWSALRNTDIFSFKLNLLQQTFYNRLFPYEKRKYHNDIAKILCTLVDQKNPLRKLDLEIARHYEIGMEYVLAAKYYFEGAQSCFYDGDLKKTREHCQKALENLKQEEKIRYQTNETETETLKLRAEIIELLLIASEMWWRGSNTLDEKIPLESLAMEAEEICSRLGNNALLSRIKYQRGKILVFSRDLESAVSMLEDALKFSRVANDHFAEFFILTELGHQLVGARGDEKMNFNCGLNLLYDALNLFETNLKGKNVLQARDLDRHLYNLKARIGIGEFDNGDYGKSLKWLSDSVEAQRKLKLNADLGWSLNFLAQVFTAIGLFEEAEQSLNEAINLEKDEGEPIALRGINLAYLGKLYLECGRIEEAASPIKQGWEETRVVNMVAMVPIIRNFYAELLMHPDSKFRNLSEAESLLHSTLQDVKQTKFYRSSILACSLLGKLYLWQEKIPDALSYSAKAVESLEKMEPMPALRKEEIFFNHYCVVKTAGSNDAKQYLKKAYATVKSKAASLDEIYREKFENNVKMTRDILSASAIEFSNGLII